MEELPSLADVALPAEPDHGSPLSTVEMAAADEAATREVIAPIVPKQ